MIQRMFVLEITYAVVDAEGDRLELKTWTIGDSEKQARENFRSRHGDYV